MVKRHLTRVEDEVDRGRLVYGVGDREAVVSMLSSLGRASCSRRMRWLPGITRMQPFSGVLSLRAIQALTRSGSSSRQLWAS